jgi:hypothetical protein
MAVFTDLVLRLEVWFVHDTLLLSLLDTKEAISSNADSGTQSRY